ncbi:MAG: hypothetical protein ACRC62_29730 [Microcoleus sp.]
MMYIESGIPHLFEKGYINYQSIGYQPIASGDARTTTIDDRRSTLNCSRH